jgi:hypothetical protein
MKHVLILQDDNLENTLILTGLIRRILKNNQKITCVCGSKSFNLLQYFPNINVINYEKLDIERLEKQNYDTLINFSPENNYTYLAEYLKIDKKLGYGIEDGFLKFYNDGAKIFHRTRYIGILQNSNPNIFQLAYGLADMRWEGEGYFLNYYPKKKCKHYAGVALKNQEWKNLVINHVKIDNNRLWVIPFKQNILKQIDEINICSHVITDDYLALHISLALRKNVEFLTGKPLPYKLETFGNGTLHILSNVKEI